MASEEVNFEPIGRYLGRNTDKVISMQKVEYRCYRCMIVDSVVISDLERSSEYIACGKCGGESKRIGIGTIVTAHKADFAELNLQDGKKLVIVN
jgi:Zn finger protein HypA/HybF involved in hydrogenase expression